MTVTLTIYIIMANNATEFLIGVPSLLGRTAHSAEERVFLSIVAVSGGVRFASDCASMVRSCFDVK